MNVILARHAMATRFELVLGADPSDAGGGERALRAAGEAALDEIERLEAQLSAFLADSELSEINRHAAQAPVRIEPRLLRFLQRARELSVATGGAFDPTVGPLLKLWGLRGEPRTTLPTAAEISCVLELVGFHNLELDQEASTVRFLREGVSLDFGGLGKGYALDRAATLLREANINCALLHAGTSSVVAIGTPPDAEAWKVAIRSPAVSPLHPFTPSPLQPFAVARLRDSALSVSAQHGRGVVIDGKYFGHTIDPRTGWPVVGALSAACICDSATEAEAWSTALLTEGSLTCLEAANPPSALLAMIGPGQEVKLEIGGAGFGQTI